MEKKRSSPKEEYEKPRIIYEKKIEVLAVVCDSTYSGLQACRITRPSCRSLRT